MKSCITSCMSWKLTKDHIINVYFRAWLSILHSQLSLWRLEEKLPQDRRGCNFSNPRALEFAYSSCNRSCIHGQVNCIFLALVLLHPCVGNFLLLQECHLKFPEHHLLKKADQNIKPQLSRADGLRTVQASCNPLPHWFGLGPIWPYDGSSLCWSCVHWMNLLVLNTGLDASSCKQ